MISQISIGTEFSIKDYTWILNNTKYVSVDTETTGLDPKINEVKIIQLYSEGKVWIIQYRPFLDYSALKLLFEDRNIKKIFHHAPFDLRFLNTTYDSFTVNNVVCTKIASKIVNGIGFNNSLKYLLKYYLQIDLNKKEQMSDWSLSKLTDSQVEYAINDVRYLKELWNAIEKELKKKKQLRIAKSCFKYLNTYVVLSNNGINNIFDY